MVLVWSRAMFARFALDQTMESFMHGHVAAFSALGGVPRTILLDYVARHVIRVLWPVRLRGRSSQEAAAAGSAPSAMAT